MEFNVNAPILFVLVGIVVAFVLAQSTFFLWRAVKSAKEIGLPQETVRKTISAAAIFTVAPAVAKPPFLVEKVQSFGNLRKAPRAFQFFQLIFSDVPQDSLSVPQFHWILLADQILQFPLSQLPDQPSPEFHSE